MGGEHDRVDPLLEVGEGPVEALDTLRIEVEGRLVQNQERHLLEKGSGEAEALEHATRSTPRPCGAHRQKAKELENLLDTFGGLPERVKSRGSRGR